MSDAATPEIPGDDAPEQPARPPCKVCDQSMEGSHPKALTHKACKKKARRKRKPTDAHAMVGGTGDARIPEPDPTPEPAGIVKVVPDLHPIEESPHAVHSYWMGTLEDCPFQTIAVCGHNFPRAMGQLVDNQGTGEPSFTGGRGQVVKIADEDVVKIQRSVARKVIRFVGKGRNLRGQKFDMDSQNYRQEKDDQPLGRFIFMHRTDALGFEARQGEPEPMVS